MRAVVALVLLSMLSLSACQFSLRNDQTEGGMLIPNHDSNPTRVQVIVKDNNSH
jgi:hypothetical protein